MMTPSMASSLVLIHPRDVIGLTPSFTACALLFDAVATSIVSTPRFILTGRLKSKADSHVFETVRGYINVVKKLRPLLKSGTLVTKTEDFSLECLIHDMYYEMAVGRDYAYGTAITKDLPRMTIDEFVWYGLGGALSSSPIEYQDSFRGVVDSAIRIVSKHWGIPVFHTRHMMISESAILARFSEIHLPVLQNVHPEQILRAKRLLRDELHPLRLHLRLVKSAIEEGADQWDIDAIITSRLIPLVSDYKSSFESRTISLLTSMQSEAKDLYLGTVSFLIALFTSQDPYLSAATGLAPPVVGVTAKYVARRKDIKEKRNKHPFGFLECF